jgi:hypothetical protein
MALSRAKSGAKSGATASASPRPRGAPPEKALNTRAKIVSEVEEGGISRQAQPRWWQALVTNSIASLDRR